MIRISLPLLLSVGLIMLICGCAGGGGAAADMFTDTVYAPAHARGFVILRAPGGASTMVVTHTPWQGASEADARRLLILRGGEKAPEGFDGKVIDGDARRIVCMSSTHVAMLDAVDATDRIAGVSGISYINTPGVKARAAEIPDVGYEGSYNYEALIAAQPDLVLLYGISAASSLEQKLDELGIPYAYVGEYLEESPLGKAEWCVAVAEMAGLRDKAEARQLQLQPRYDALRSMAAADTIHPKVMINTPYADSWQMAPPSSYVGHLIADAGGRYIYTPADTATNRSLAIDMEQAYRLASQADVWINTGQISTLGEMRSLYPRFADTPAMHAGRVWNSSSDYWESGVMNPDRVLADLIKIFHPALLPDSAFTYYQQLK